MGERNGEGGLVQLTAARRLPLATVRLSPGDTIVYYARLGLVVTSSPFVTSPSRPNEIPGSSSPRRTCSREEYLIRPATDGSVAGNKFSSVRFDAVCQQCAVEFQSVRRARIFHVIVIIIISSSSSVNNSVDR